MQTKIEIGTICKIHGLKMDPEVNGRYVEVLTPLVEIATPERDGVIRSALRYGCEVITKPCTEFRLGPVNGYFKPENLYPVVGDRRSWDLHLFS